MKRTRYSRQVWVTLLEPLVERRLTPQPLKLETFTRLCNMQVNVIPLIVWGRNEPSSFHARGASDRREARRIEYVIYRREVRDLLRKLAPSSGVGY
jgi:hypothetical protein